MFDQKTNKRLSEDYSTTGVDISQRASRKSLIKTQTRQKQCDTSLLVVFNQRVCFGNLMRFFALRKISKKQDGLTLPSKFRDGILALSRSPEIAVEVLKGVIRPQNGAAILGLIKKIRDNRKNFENRDDCWGINPQNKRQGVILA